MPQDFFGQNRCFRFLSAFLLALLLPAAALAGARSPTDGTVRVGDLAPDFELRDLQGKTVRLSDHLGSKPVLLVFWSFFCFPCQKEMPVFDSLYREMTPERFTVIGICLDGPRYDSKVLPFLREKDITFPNAYDIETEEFFEVAGRYGVVGTPTSFLVDPSGRIRFIHLGRIDPPVLASMVNSARDQSYCPDLVKPPPAVVGSSLPDGQAARAVSAD